MTTAEIKTNQRRRDIDLAEADMRQMLSAPTGRRLLMRIVTLAGVYRSTSASSDIGLAHEAGRRDLGLEILAAANRADPGAVIAAYAERHETIQARLAEVQTITQQKEQ